VSGLGNFPERSVVNLAKFQQSSRQNSFSHRRADWIFGSEIRFWREFVVSNRQPLFVFCNGVVPGPSGFIVYSFFSYLFIYVFVVFNVIFFYIYICFFSPNLFPRGYVMLYKEISR